MTKTKEKRKIKKPKMIYQNFYRCKDCGYGENSYISDEPSSKGSIFETECADCGVISDMKYVKSITREETAIDRCGIYVI